MSYAATLGIIAVGIYIWFLIPPPPPPPPESLPQIEIATSLEEPSPSTKNGSLDAGEKARFLLMITNKGKIVRNVEIRFEPAL